MYTTDNDHGAEFQMHTGRHQLDEQQPTIGSWASYGLGTLNENLPQFVFLGQYKDVRVKKDFAADYLGPRYARRGAVARPQEPAAVRGARQGRAGEGAAAALRLRQRTERPRRRRVPGRRAGARRASRATNWRSGCRRPCPRCSTSIASRRRSRTSTASTTRPPRSTAGGCWRRGGWRSRACASRWCT